MQTRCDTDTSTTPHLYKLGRIDRQSYGSRFMLGLVSLGDAARYGLRTAALETKQGSYVTPSPQSLAAALQLETQQDKYGPFVLDQADIRRSTRAYPGTMVVYTAARLRNLPQADADKVAQFIRVSTTEGQQPGSGNGQLPDGFLPIRSTGVTAPLYRSAQEVAAAVEAQKAEPPVPTTSATPTSDGGSSPGTTPASSSGGVPGEAPGNGAAPSAAASASPSPSTGQEAAAMPATQPVSSPLAGGLLPALLLLGGLGLGIAGVVRVGASSVGRKR
ncbi:hypothetical protein [Nocardioides ungokensis]|uniref:hypothetical protein n=1 Tax=Nocardioides ungokensis TaxID=1643322 RepID=UPI0015DD5996|nr:hypothetical protein [Nocardioides ungokensis]